MVVYSIIEAVGLIIAAAAIYYLLTIEASREHKIMLMTLLLITAQNVGVFIELGSTTYEGAMNAVIFEYAAASFFSLSYCYFVMVHCNRRINRLFINIGLLLSFASILLVWSDRYFHFFYREAKFIQEPWPHMEIIYNWGIIVYIMALLLPFAHSVIELSRQIGDEKEIHQRQALVILLALSFLPIMVMIIHVTNPNGGFDFAPVVGLLSVCVAIFMFVKLKSFDVVRMAQLKAIESMNDAVITIDEGLHVLYYNDAAKALFPKLTSVGKDDTVTLATGLAVANFTQVGNNSFIFNDRNFESHVSTITDSYEQLRGYSIVIIDVTKIKAYAEKVIKQKESASVTKNEVTKKLSDRIAFSLMEIIEEIINKSRAEAGKMDVFEAPYDLDKLCMELCTMVKFMAEEHNLEFRFNLNKDIPKTLLGDYEKIKQIAVNILSNAVKFTNKGYVELDIDYEVIGENDINFIMRVKDTGIGISEERQKEIVNSICNLDLKSVDIEGGKGYGLAISKDLTELMDGFIDMESKLGEGSTFTVIIPQKIVNNVPIKETIHISEPEKKMFTCPNTKILIVDDNKINLKVAVGLLGVYNADVEEALSGMEAIEKVKNKMYDIIFMDHMMPEMDGMEATAIIRSECGENGKKPIIVALTANALKGAADMFIGHGFDDFMAKPIDKDELRELLRKYVKREDLVEGEVIKEENPKSTSDIEQYRMNNVDIESALKIHSDSIKNVLDLMVLFYEDGVNKVDVIRNYADEGELRSYEIEVHGLKSAAANIGAKKLSEEAKTHEYAAKDGDEAFVIANYEQLASDYKEVLEELKNMLMKNGLIMSAEKEEEGLPPLDDEFTLKNKLNEILEDLEDFKSKEAMAHVNELLKFKIGGDRRAAVNNIKSKLKLYDDDAAEDLLRDLIKNM